MKIHCLNWVIKMIKKYDKIKLKPLKPCFCNSKVVDILKKNPNTIFTITNIKCADVSSQDLSYDISNGECVYTIKERNWEIICMELLDDSLFIFGEIK